MLWSQNGSAIWQGLRSAPIVTPSFSGNVRIFNRLTPPPAWSRVRRQSRIDNGWVTSAARRWVDSSRLCRVCFTEPSDETVGQFRQWLRSGECRDIRELARRKAVWYSMRIGSQARSSVVGEQVRNFEARHTIMAGT